MRPLEATEDFVLSFYVPSPVQESKPDASMDIQPVSNMEAGIRECMLVVSESEKILRQQRDGIVLTIPKDDQHVMVLSTGRCGTKSLEYLLHISNLTPYHEYWWTVEAPYRHEMQARIQSAKFDDLHCISIWCQTRAIEWLEASRSGKPLVALNHLDTIFAPAFASIHHKSRFVWLKRDPESVFKSFYGKDQWGNMQLRPLQFAFDPFRYADGGYDLIQAIAWYIRFTEVFIQSFKSVVGDRLMEVNSEDLFNRDRSVIKNLLDFIGAGVPVDRAVDHFIKPINEKAHRIIRTQEQMEEGIKIFHNSLNHLKETGYP